MNFNFIIVPQKQKKKFNFKSQLDSQQKIHDSMNLVWNVPKSLTHRPSKIIFIDEILQVED